jgi:hypothetical protein
MKAFPGNRFEGMELRDYFAKDFATTLMALTNIIHNEEYIQSICKKSYVWADAMMEARVKE